MPELASLWSLQTRVRMISAVAMCTGLVFGGIGMYRAAAVEDDQITDERVERLAVKILASVQEDLARHSAAGVSPDLLPRVERQESGLHKYQVWLHNGSHLFRSHNASELHPLMPIGSTGYDQIKIDGQDYCAFAAATPDGEIVVQVAEQTPERLVQIGLLSAKYFAFILLPLGLIFVVTQWLLKRTFHSLDHLAADLRSRGPRDVTTMAIKDPPREILPIVRSLDSLFRRIGFAMSLEHRFTSVAAHELRTPLAGIRAQAQLACKASSPHELQESLASVMVGVDRASRVIEQLIDLHRIEGTGNDINWGNLPIDLAHVYEQIMDELGPKARAKNIALNVRLEATQIHGIDFAIYMLLRNLIANAIQYCPEGGRVDVRTQHQGDDVALTVDDSGPGIPVTARERAFEKFNRLGRSDSEGVGLGLSIVAQVAEMHRAKVELLGSPLGGLRAQVLFRRLA
ncbi:MAG: hypothetical protein K2X51_07750 [Burkholderiales bacterium]|nr:hypothetical protein [Burkholderiales bacterium]